VRCSEWHLSTQILYFVAAVLILVAEIFARSQLCCDEESQTRNYASIGIVVIVSGRPNYSYFIRQEAQLIIAVIADRTAKFRPMSGWSGKTFSPVHQP